MYLSIDEATLEAHDRGVESEEANENRGGVSAPCRSANHCAPRGRAWNDIVGLDERTRGLRSRAAYQGEEASRLPEAPCGWSIVCARS